MHKKYKKEIYEFFKELKYKKISKKEFENKKIEFSKKYKLKKMLLNSDVLYALNISSPQNILITKPSRTLSGVTVVAIMAPPSPCPGKCIYCPNSSNVPKSYTGFEPATMRAKRNNFSAYKQIKERLKQLELTGHPTTKIELIVMGGTFPANTKKYQLSFVKDIYRAITNSKSNNLKELKKKAMYSKKRLIGLTFETRPDYCDKKTIKQLLNYGATKVEIGVQINDDSVLKYVNRGHYIKEIVEATKNLKDAGFKVLYHLMVGLPGSSIKNDLEKFKEIFSSPLYCPDMIKIYPTLVTKNTILEKWLKRGTYKPYDLDKTIKLIADIKEVVPKWVRIMRIQRDIPSTQIIEGVKKSNLRELVQQELKKRGKKCNCIRCSEPKEYNNFKNYEIKSIEYKASKGKEYFVYAEEKDLLLGFIRLRFSGASFTKNIGKKTSIVRELHVYGKTSEFKEKNVQHKGIGKKLLKIAEDITLKEKYKSIAIISGIGVREYYKKQGYILKEPYMVKILK